MKTDLTRRELLMGVGSVAAGIALAGCSSNSTTSTTSTDSSTSEDDSYTLVEEGKLICASDLAAPPLDYVEDNEDKGFEVELMQAIAGKLGLVSEYLAPMKFDSIIPLIKQGGKADVGVSNFTITDERKLEIDFSDPYLDSNQGVATRADYADDNLTALNAAGKKIVVQSGSTGDDWVKENMTQAERVALDDPIVGMTGVQAGSYDAVIYDLPVLSYLCSSSYTDCKIAVEIPTGEQYGIVVSKDNPGLTKAINKALSELEDDGTISQLQIKWFGSEV